jgi:hypothetical protein
MSDDEKENFVIQHNDVKEKSDLAEIAEKSENKNKFNRGITFYESIKKGPLEKFISHGIFPWKLTITILLVIFTICQSVIIMNRITSYNRAHIRTLYNLFLDNGDKTDCDFHKLVYLYSIEELRNQIKSSVDNYYNIHQLTMDPMEYPNANPSPVLELKYIDNKLIKNNGHLANHKLSENLLTLTDSTQFLDRKFFYKLNQTSLGPFDYTDNVLKEFLNDVQDFKVNYTLISKYPYIYEDNFECNVWNIYQIYSFQSRGHFVMSLDIHSEACRESFQVISWWENFNNKLLYVHLVVIILSVSSIYLISKSMYILIKMYMEAKNRLKKKKEEHDKKMGKDQQKKGQNISLTGSSINNTISSETSSDSSVYFNPLFESLTSDEDDLIDYKQRENLDYNDNEKVLLDTEQSLAQRKLSLFGTREKDGNAFIQLEPGSNKKQKVSPKKHFQYVQFWSTWIIIGNILQLCGSCLALNYSNEVSTNIAILIGSGCFFACLSTGKYIQFQPEYSTIYEALRLSFPVVTRYLIGVFPIYLGFLFLGLCLFWRSERFDSTSRASYTLFSLVNGDAVFDSFTDLSSIGPILGSIFCYSFCIIFILIVLNIFISIIEEAYVVNKLRNKTSWIFQHVKIEPKLVDLKLHSKPSLLVTKKYFKNMEKSSEILKKRLSKSLRSKELLGRERNKSEKGESYSYEELSLSKPKSLSKSHQAVSNFYKEPKSISRSHS